MQRYIAILQALWNDPHTRWLVIVIMALFAACQIAPEFFPTYAAAFAKADQVISRFAVVLALVIGSQVSGPVAPTSPLPPLPPIPPKPE